VEVVVGYGAIHIARIQGVCWMQYNLALLLRIEMEDLEALVEGGAEEMAHTQMVEPKLTLHCHLVQQAQPHLLLLALVVN
jgi:hypothetical protein